MNLLYVMQMGQPVSLAREFGNGRLTASWRERGSTLAFYSLGSMWQPLVLVRVGVSFYVRYSVQHLDPEFGATGRGMIMLSPPSEESPYWTGWQEGCYDPDMRGDKFSFTRVEAVNPRLVDVDGRGVWTEDLVCHYTSLSGQGRTFTFSVSW